MTDSEDSAGARHHRAGTAMPVTAMIAGIGEHAALRFIDFATAHPPI